jgi:hypothetical protein
MSSVGSLQLAVLLLVLSASPVLLKELMCGECTGSSVTVQHSEVVVARSVMWVLADVTLIIDGGDTFA